jgi:holo-[acyl-carrier protein] synthase
VTNPSKSNATDQQVAPESLAGFADSAEGAQDSPVAAQGSVSGAAAQQTNAATSAFAAVAGAVGLGVDIVEIERMRKILKRSPAFARKAFSDEERSYCEKTATPEAHFATRFAAKEAVLKALGTGFSQGIGVRDVEVKRTSKGRPYAVLTGRAKRVAQSLGVRELPLSLSFTHAEAVACAMAITDGSVRAQEERRDPMEELSRQFKEARAMLDDLDASAPDKPAETEKPSAMAAMSMVASAEDDAAQQTKG